MQDKRKFEQEREKTLKALPDAIKASFGKIGFSIEVEGEPPAPILILSPYDVPPRPFRDIYWFDLYTKAKKAKKLDNLAYLAYHYGAQEDFYSFIEQEDFIDFETGKEKGYDTLPASIAEKVEKGEELSEEEQQLVRGLEELKEDLDKECSERKRGALFQERHDEEDAPPPAKRQKGK